MRLPLLLLLTAHCWLVAAPAVAAAGECGPVARVNGDGALPATVTTLLLEQGVSPAPTHCESVVATLTRTPDGLLLRMEDAEGRSQEHHVANAAVAAVVIESWVRDDLYASLLPIPSAPASLRVGASAPAAIAPTTSLSIGFGANAGGANDGTLWGGASAAGCVRLDRLCVGALVRFVSDVDWIGESARLQSNRQGYEAALTADFPLELGGVPVVPGVGLGFRTLETVADEDVSDARVAVQPSDLLIATHLRSYLPMDDNFLLEFSLGLDLYPTAHTSHYKVGEVTLAGDPIWTANAGVGFRIGAW